MVKFNPEIHTLIYEDSEMISYWEHDTDCDVVTIYQVGKYEEEDCGFVCIETSALRKILETIEGTDNYGDDI